MTRRGEGMQRERRRGIERIEKMRGWRSNQWFCERRGGSEGGEIEDIKVICGRDGGRGDKRR